VEPFEKTVGSLDASNDGSFLSAGDDMKEIEKPGSLDPLGSTAWVDEDVASAAALAVDAFSVASSMVSDILKEAGIGVGMGKVSSAISQSDDDDEAASAFASSVVTDTNISAKVAGASEVEAFKAEDVRDSEDEWSVVSNGTPSVKSPDSVGNIIGTEMKVMEEEDNADRSLSSFESLSPVVLVKRDIELVQMLELSEL